MDIKQLIFDLCSADCIGNVDDALTVATAALDGLCRTERLFGNSLVGYIEGEGDRTVLIEAHIDEIGFVVTSVDDEGFLKVAAAGGFDLRTLPSHEVTVHGKQKLPAVFTSIPPHLSKGEAEFDDIKALSLDTGLGKRAKDLISVGDFVTYRRTPASLAGERVTAKALDDRAGCAALIYLAKLLEGKRPPVNVTLLFSDQEELGCRGAKTSAFTLDCDEAVAIDVSFAAFPGIAPEQCGKLGHGGMIGQSPILSRAVSRSLIAAAEKNNIPYQLETMGGTTSTDADAITVSKDGVPTGLVSVPQRNMHTDAEVVDMGDVKAVAELLYAYIMAGGAANA